jgi:hypothetical protein
LSTCSRRPPDAAREALQLRLGRVIEREVLPHYRKPFPRVPRMRLAGGLSQPVDHPLHAIVDGRALDYASYRSGLRAGLLPARAIHGPLHAARTALWAGLIATLRRRHAPEHGGDVFLVQVAAAFHDAAREDEGTDRWERESEALFRRWCERHRCDAAGASGPVAQLLLGDADTLEILRVLPSPRYFDVTRLGLVREALVPRADVDRLVSEVLRFIRITESAESKPALEESGALYFMLMRSIVQLDASDALFPLLHDLLRELSGQ